MKILFAVANDLTTVSGSNIRVLEIVNALLKCGHEVVLFSYRSPETFLNNQIIFRALPLPPSRLLGKLVFYVISPVYLLYLILRNKPDLIYTLIHMRFLSPAIAAGLTRRPFVVEVNGFVRDELQALGSGRVTVWYSEIVERISYGIAKKIITVTKGLREVLSESFKIDPDRIVVIPNGVNHGIYMPMDRDTVRTRLNLPTDQFIILFLGYLARWQGISTLIDSFSSIKSEFPYARVLIVGWGPEAEALRRLARNHEFGTDIHLIDRVPENIAADYINAADVCVAPFTSERNSRIGLSPLKIYSYMACRRPVVASDIQGVGDFIRESNGGLVVPPDNPQELADSIKLLLTDNELSERLASSGYSAVLEKFTWERVVESLEKVLLEALEPTE